jgi:NADP-dependent 3-hydroxy acid dehydrogenase YdfG
VIKTEEIVAKIALITGASSGLGQAMAKKLLTNDW